MSERQRQDTGTTVLVVEDEVLVRMAVADEMIESGYSVIEAADAAEAIAVLEAGHPVDIVFSDVRMPGAIDGLGLLALIRRRYPHIPVILTSAHHPTPSDGPRPDAIFVPKPYIAAAVLKLIGKAIAERRHSGGGGDAGAA